MTKTNDYMVLFTMMMVSLLSTAGIALPYPILAPLFLDPVGTELTTFAGIHPKILLAIVLATYPLGLLVGSSFIAALSDSYGRKRILLISLFLSVIGYLATAVALSHENYLLFLLARFVTGIFEGNLPLARAITADLHPRIDKTRSFSWMYATTYAGWLIGPLAGGYLMVYSPQSAFYAAAAAILLSALFVFALIPNDNISPQNNGSSIWQAIIQQNSLGLLSEGVIRQVFFAYLMLNLGLNAFYEFYPLWLVDVFDFNSVSIGHITALLTIMMVLASAFMVEMAKNRFGKIPTIVTGLTLLSAALIALPLVNRDWLYLYFATLGGLIALYNGLLPVYFSDRYEHLGQGRLLGLLTTTFYIANTLIALLGGLISLLGAQWSIVFGGVLMLFGLLYLVYFDRTVPPPVQSTLAAKA